MAGLGIHTKLRKLFAYINLIRFTMRNLFLGFDVSNQFIQRVDKFSLLLILKKYGATIGKDVDIETGLIFHNSKDYSNLTIGNNCHIGKNCFFDLRDRVNIADNVVISMQCTFITHIDMSKSDLRSIYPASSKSINIGRNTYVGVESTILKGVSIGANTIIAAKSLVNKNIEDNSIVGGIPVKYIKKVLDNGAKKVN